MLIAGAFAVGYYFGHFGSASSFSDVSHLRATATEEAAVGRCQQAVPDLQVVLAEDPIDYQAWGLLGSCLNSLGQYGRAVAPLSRAVTHDPGFLSAFVTASCVSGDAGVCESSLRRSSGLTDSYLLRVALATKAVEYGAPDAAVAILGRVSLEERGYAWYDEASQANAILGNFTLAISQANEACTLAPNGVRGHEEVVLGVIYGQAGDYRLQALMLAKALATGENMGRSKAEVTSMLGNDAYELGQYSSAVKYDFAAVRLASSVAEKYGALYQLANAYIQMGDYGGAMSSLRAIVVAANAPPSISANARSLLDQVEQLG